MAFCTNCGADVTGKNFCVGCGKPVGAAQPAASAGSAAQPLPAQSLYAAPQPVPPPQYASAPPPGPPMQTGPKKTSPIVWIVVGIVGFFVLVGLVITIGVGLFVHKVKQNPALAMAKLLTAANPDVEVLSADEGRNSVKFRDKKTGETFSVNLDDIKNGRIDLQGAEGREGDHSGAGRRAKRLARNQGARWHHEIRRRRQCQDSRLDSRLSGRDRHGELLHAGRRWQRRHVLLHHQGSRDAVLAFYDRSPGRRRFQDHCERDRECGQLFRHHDFGGG